jgi:putative chitobiose transport system permease protein
MIRTGRITPLLYAGPTLAFVAAVFAYPLIQLFHYSFENVGQSAYVPTTWAGLSNYRYIYSDSLFTGALQNNLELFLCVPVLVVLSVIVAAILHDRPFGWKAYRTILFVPYVLSIPMVGVVFGYLLEYNGNVNVLLRDGGLGGLARDWLGSPAYALPTIMFVIVWKELGFGIVLCNARLSSADEAVFEAARVDGASWWQSLWHVTIPQLVPALAFFAVVEFINMLSWVFAYIYVMTLGGPENSTVVSEYYIYQQVFQNDAIGVGAAAGVTLLGIVCVLIAARIWADAKIVSYGYQ